MVANALKNYYRLCHDVRDFRCGSQRFAYLLLVFIRRKSHRKRQQRETDDFTSLQQYFQYNTFIIMNKKRATRD